MLEEKKKRNLSPELMDLMEHEKVIEQGLAGFLEVGDALLRIRDGKKYKAALYNTFEEYCLKRWSMSVRRGQQLMAAAETVTEMRTDVRIPEPATEAQVRALTPIRDEPEKVDQAWGIAVEAADGGQPTAEQVKEAVDWVMDVEPATPPITKPDLGGGISHPARFSKQLFPVFADLLEPGMTVLDPFAGAGGIHELADFIDIHITAVEIEPEWAALHPLTDVGDALDLKYDDGTFDAIVTSPTYGNRLADHHNASDPELRRSYTHDLGRELSEENSGDLHWGEAYRDFHARAWTEAVRVLKPGGRFVLNIKDHIRAGSWQDVAGWHVSALHALGLEVFAFRPVVTGHLRQGENAALRADAEMIIGFTK